MDPDDYRRVFVIDGTSVHMTQDATALSPVWRTLLTVPMGSSTSRSLGLKNLQAVEFVKSGPTEVLLVGGHGGVFRTLDPKPSGPVHWHEFGQGLPNTVVFDLNYDDDGRGTLLAGTLGRGAWKIDKARDALTASHALTIDGTSDVDAIRVSRNVDKPHFLDVEINGSTDTFQGSTVSNIVINGKEAVDDIVLDFGGGIIEAGFIFVFGGGPGPDGATLDLERGGNSGLVRMGVSPASNFTISKRGEGSVDVTIVQVQGTVGSDIPDPSGAVAAATQHGAEHMVASLHGPDLFGEAFPGLGTSFAGVADGVNIIDRPQVSDPVSEAAEVVFVSEIQSGAFLRRLFENADGAFVFNQLDDQVVDAEALRSLLDGLDDVDDNVMLTESPGETRFDVRIQDKKMTGTGRLDLDASGGAVGVSGTLDLAFDVDVHLILGVNDGGVFLDTSADPEFVARNIRIDGDLVATGQFGFLEVDLSEGTLQLDPQVKLEVDLQAPGDLLRVGDLAAFTDDMVSTTLTGNTNADDVVLTGNFQIAATFPGAGALMAWNWSRPARWRPHSGP